MITFPSCNSLNKLVLCILLACSVGKAQSLGVLTHEAIIDAAWGKSILPYLKSNYPKASEEELKDAHAYAYGGAVAPDMGYYPFGNPFFTNLIHYVRSGDIVKAMLEEAQTLNELAFAVGFLSHYEADNYGHPGSTNISVPVVYPRMKRKFGDTVTYANNEISHKRMEFGFDVLQTARGNYASNNYHDFIGFKVDTAVLSRAFYKTYGLDIHEVFNNHLNFTVEFFRYIVANVFPILTKTAWARKKSALKKLDTTATAQSFRYKNRISKYNKEFGKGYQGPGFFSTMLSVFIRVIPKVGPFRALKFKVPTEQAERYFVAAFDSTILNIGKDLRAVHSNKLDLENADYDTGELTAHCEYPLANVAYDTWLLKLSEKDFKTSDAAIASDIRRFYHNFQPPKKDDCKHCRKVSMALGKVQKTQDSAFQDK